MGKKFLSQAVVMKIQKSSFKGKTNNNKQKKKKSKKNDRKSVSIETSCERMREYEQSKHLG